MRIIVLFLSLLSFIACSNNNLSDKISYKNLVAQNQTIINDVTLRYNLDGLNLLTGEVIDLESCEDLSLVSFDIQGNASFSIFQPYFQSETLIVKTDDIAFDSIDYSYSMSQMFSFDSIGFMWGEFEERFAIASQEGRFFKIFILNADYSELTIAYEEITGGARLVLEPHFEREALDLVTGEIRLADELMGLPPEEFENTSYISIQNMGPEEFQMQAISFVELGVISNKSYEEISFSDALNANYSLNAIFTASDVVVVKSNANNKIYKLGNIQGDCDFAYIAYEEITGGTRLVLEPHFEREALDLVTGEIRLAEELIGAPPEEFENKSYISIQNMGPEEFQMQAISFVELGVISNKSYEEISFSDALNANYSLNAIFTASDVVVVKSNANNKIYKLGNIQGDCDFAYIAYEEITGGTRLVLEPHFEREALDLVTGEIRLAEELIGAPPEEFENTSYISIQNMGPEEFQMQAISFVELGVISNKSYEEISFSDALNANYSFNAIFTASDVVVVKSNANNKIYKLGNIQGDYDFAYIAYEEITGGTRLVLEPHFEREALDLVTGEIRLAEELIGAPPEEFENTSYISIQNMGPEEFQMQAISFVELGVISNKSYEEISFSDALNANYSFNAIFTASDVVVVKSNANNKIYKLGNIQGDYDFAYIAYEEITGGTRLVLEPHFEREALDLVTGEIRLAEELIGAPPEEFENTSYISIQNMGPEEFQMQAISFVELGVISNKSYEEISFSDALNANYSFNAIFTASDVVVVKSNANNKIYKLGNIQGDYDFAYIAYEEITVGGAIIEEYTEAISLETGLIENKDQPEFQSTDSSIFMNMAYGDTIFTVNIFEETGASLAVIENREFNRVNYCTVRRIPSHGYGAQKDFDFDDVIVLKTSNNEYYKIAYPMGIFNKIAFAYKRIRRRNGCLTFKKYSTFKRVDFEMERRIYKSLKEKGVGAILSFYPYSSKPLIIKLILF